MFTNVGDFLPGSIEEVIRHDAPLPVYRYRFLAEAMVQLNIIDTIGSGIKRMFTKQRQRNFPLPDNGRREYLPIAAGKKGDKAVEAVLEHFRDKERRDELRKLIEEVRQARQERDASQRSPEAFAVYWLLKKDGVAGVDEVAKAAEVAFAEHPHWQTSSQQEREVRKSLFKALIDAGVEAVVEVGESVLKILRRAIS